MFSSVLLPDPLGPMMASLSPIASSNEMPRRTTNGSVGVGYCLVTLETTKPARAAPEVGATSEGLIDVSAVTFMPEPYSRAGRKGHSKTLPAYWQPYGLP